MPDLIEPFQFEFMVRAMIAAALVGSLTSAIGVFVVLRRLAYIGHGLAHSIFGGAVVAFVAGFNFYIGASIWGGLSAFLINVARGALVDEDALAEAILGGKIYLSAYGQGFGATGLTFFDELRDGTFQGAVYGSRGAAGAGHSVEQVDDYRADLLFGDVGHEGARHDGVDPDLGGESPCQALCQVVKPGLGRAVGGTTGSTYYCRY